MSLGGLLLVGLAMAVGLAGTIVPVLPGTALIWAAALVYGLLAGFGALGWFMFVLITLLAVGGTVAKYFLPTHQAFTRTPWSTLLVAGVLALVGFFVVPVVGLPLGFAAGVLAAEYRRLGEWAPAWATTKGVVVGLGVGVAIEFGAGFVMVFTWIAWVVGNAALV
jgi:uncharacterized protein YqgC (DUF456 family)